MSRIVVPGAIAIQKNPFFVPLVSGPPPFSPTDISNIELWLDANDLATITKDGSNLVSQWNDKSGLANNATQPVAISQPVYSATSLNSKPSITQSGSPQFMALTTPINISSLTFFLVGYVPDTVTSCSFLGGTATAPNFIATSGGGEFYDGSSYIDFTFTYTANQGWILSGQMTANIATAVPYENGVAQSVVGSSGAAWANTINLIGVRKTSLYVKGGYSEIIMYSRTLTAPEKLQVINYLISKWTIV